MAVRLRNRSEKKLTFLDKLERFRGRIARISICLLTAVLCFLIILGFSAKERKALEVGDISQSTEYATRTIVDRYTTAEQKEKAYNNIISTGKRYFDVDPTIQEDALSGMGECFSSMRRAVTVGQDWLHGRPNQKIWGIAAAKSTEDEFSDALIHVLSEYLAGNFTDAEIRGILHMSVSEISALEDICLSLVAREMTDTIPNTDNALSARLNTVYSSIQEERLTDVQKFLGKTIVSQYMVENRFYDRESTLAAAQAAADAVGNTMVREGQLIVSQGEAVSEAQLVLLTDLGLVHDENTGIMLSVGMAVLVSVVCAVGMLYMLVYRRDLTHSTEHVLMLCVSLLLVLLVCALLQSISLYLAPVTLMTMWAIYMADRRSALMLGAVASVLYASITTDASNVISLEAFSIVGSSLMASTTIVLTMRRSNTRGAVIGAGLVGGLTSALFLTGVLLIRNVDITEVLYAAFMGMCGNLLAAIACLGSIPVFEIVFHLVTPMKYLELSNPNQPLLKRLLLEAPGTYQHSIVVGNLAENAAEAVGANAMLARAVACYHDIGKLKRPYFFKENQIGSGNPHDNISAELSTRIIISHVTDGLELGKKYHLPPQILDGITQHHGDTLVGYFYAKAKKEAEDPESVRESDFRYPGTRPVTKESAILMLADSVEAAARTLSKPTRQGLEELVARICQGKLNDGQLDLCKLTLGEIDRIQQEFVKALSAIYHERIEYPTIPAARR